MCAMRCRISDTRVWLLSTSGTSSCSPLDWISSKAASVMFCAVCTKYSSGLERKKNHKIYNNNNRKRAGGEYYLTLFEHVLVFILNNHKEK